MENFKFIDNIKEQPKQKEIISINKISYKRDKNFKFSKIKIKDSFISDNLILIILNYLDYQSLSNVEIANKYLYKLTEELFKRKYLELTDKMFIQNYKNQDKDKSNKLRENENKKLEDKESKILINYKSLNKSLKNSFSVTDFSRNIYTIHLDNLNLGASYINYISSYYGISENYSHTLNEKLAFRFKESFKGFFEPKSIIINSDIDFNFDLSNLPYNNNHITNFSTSNTLEKIHEDCYVNFKNIDINEDCDLLFEKIRKEAEISDKPIEFFITCSNNPALTQISSYLKTFIEDEFCKNKVIVTPVFIKNYEQFSPILLKNWINENNIVMQYEKDSIEETALKQLFFFPNNHIFKNYSNRIFVRALNGLMVDEIEYNKYIPYPTISLLQSSFSPCVFPLTKTEQIIEEKNEINNLKHFKKNGKFNYSIGEIAEECLFFPYLHKRRLDEKLICMTMNMHFFGDVVSKDILAVLGNIKTFRKVEFLDWSPAVLKYNTEYSHEKIFDISVPRSCHVIGNTSDSKNFYEQMNTILKDDKIDNIYKKTIKTGYNEKIFSYDENEEIEELKEFIKNKYNDYREIYSPSEEYNENE